MAMDATDDAAAMRRLAELLDGWEVEIVRAQGDSAFIVTLTGLETGEVYHFTGATLHGAIARAWSGR